MAADPAARPETRASRPARSLVVRLLVVLASVAVVLAVVAGYVRHTLVDSDQFAARATDALRDDSVRSLIAQRITDQVVLRNQADLLAARPIIESVTDSVVGGGAFGGLFRRGVRDLHRALFDRDQHTLTLTVTDVGTVLAAALEVVRPSLADRVRATERVDVVTRDIGSASARAARAARTVRLLATLLLVVAVACSALAVALAADRRTTIVELGIGAAVGGILIVVACAVGRSIALGRLHDPDERAAADAVWDAFLGDLRSAGWIVAGSGAVIAAAAASLIRPIDLREPLVRLGHALAREPRRPAWRAVRGVALVAAGFVVLVEREAVLTILLTIAGVYLIYAGVSSLLWLIYEPGEAAQAKATLLGRRQRRRRRLAEHRRPLVAGALAVVLVAAGASAFVGSGAVNANAHAAAVCEGHAELCDKPLDEVALAATHNAMSVPLPGWYSAEQDRPIADQLRDGVRGLLVDTHYADRLANGRLRTEIGDASKLARQDGVSEQALQAALRIRDRAGFSGQGKRGMYLCHTFCELGGTRLEDLLQDLHDFLVANPTEVVVVINQDYVTPADFVGAVRRAGLERLAITPPAAGAPWPTLGELVARDRRVLFLAENHAGAAPWYQPVYQRLTEETPYTFGSTRLLTDPADRAASCRPNRGPAGAPLFLVNHWVSTDPVPLPSNAAAVNAYGPLLARVRECQRIRHHLPNLVAVNFYRRGDVFKVVDTLNGVG